MRSLVLHGLTERWGVLDSSLNRDLDDIAATYAGGVVLTAWTGARLVGAGVLMPLDAGVAEVRRMSVVPDWRRRAVGSVLL